VASGTEPVGLDPLPKLTAERVWRHEADQHHLSSGATYIYTRVLVNNNNNNNNNNNTTTTNNNNTHALSTSSRTFHIFSVSTCHRGHDRSPGEFASPAAAWEPLGALALLLLLLLLYSICCCCYRNVLHTSPRRSRSGPAPVSYGAPKLPKQKLINTYMIHTYRQTDIHTYIHTYIHTNKTYIHQYMCNEYAPK